MAKRMAAMAFPKFMTMVMVTALRADLLRQDRVGVKVHSGLWYDEQLDPGTRIYTPPNVYVYAATATCKPSHFLV